MTRLPLITLLLFPLFASTAAADVDFYRDVYPILKSNCIACHNKTTTESSLNLESPETVRSGGDSGPGVVAGKAAESLIYLASQHEGDTVMPPAGNTVGAKDLTPEELKILGDWINAGAKDSVREVKQVVWRALPPGLHSIYSVDLSQDGRWGASGRGNLISIYDLATFKLDADLIDSSLPAVSSGAQRSHQALVQSLAFSPDGERLASGSFGEVKIWKRQPSVAAGAVLTVPESVATLLNSSGTQALVVDAAGSLHVIDVQSGNSMRTIAGALAGPVSQCLIASQGDRVALASAGSIHVWDVASGVRIAEISAPAATRALSWVSQGTALAVAGTDQIVRIWTLPNDPAGSLPEPREFPALPQPIVSLSVMSNPDLLLAGCETGDCHVCQISDGKVTAAFKIPGGTTFAVSSDGKYVAGGCGDGSVKIWDLAANKLLTELKGNLETRRQLAAVNWRLAVQNLDKEYQNKEVARLTAANKALDELLKKANETIEAVKKVLPEREEALAKSTTAKDAAQGEVDQVMQEIAQLAENTKKDELDKKLQSGQQALMKAAEQESSAQKQLRTSQNHFQDATNEVERSTAAKTRNTELLTAATEAVAAATKAVTEATAELAELQKTVASGNVPVIAVAFSADSNTVAAVSSNGEQRFWGVRSGMLISQVSAAEGTGAGSLVSPAAGSFVTLYAGKTHSITTVGRWELERVLGGSGNPTAFSDRVNAVKFSPDGKVLAAGGGDPTRSGEISLWNVDRGDLIATWKDCHKDAVLSLAFSPDGELIASGSADRMVKVTEVATGKTRFLFEGHTHHALGVNFRADGRLLASAGAEGAVLIWDMQTGERSAKITGWNKEVTSARFLGATTQIVAAAGDPAVRVVKDQGGEVRMISKNPEFQYDIATSADGSVIMAGGEQGVVRVWNSADGKELAAFEP